jgi:hypothetical protein
MTPRAQGLYNACLIRRDVSVLIQQMMTGKSFLALFLMPRFSHGYKVRRERVVLIARIFWTRVNRVSVLTELPVFGTGERAADASGECAAFGISILLVHVPS